MDEGHNSSKGKLLSTLLVNQKNMCAPKTHWWKRHKIIILMPKG